MLAYFVTKNIFQKILRAGFEPATYGCLTEYNYSPPLYQLSYRRNCVKCSKFKGHDDTSCITMTFKTSLEYSLTPVHVTYYSQGGGVAQMVERSLSMREVPGSIPGASRYFLHLTLSSKILPKVLHRPGIEPGPPAWQASILPLNQRCHMENFYFFLLILSKR